MRVKLAKSFARIHKANLVNFGVVPLTFRNPEDYDLIKQGATLTLRDLRTLVTSGSEEIPLNLGDRVIIGMLQISDRERKELLAGGALNFVRKN